MENIQYVSGKGIFCDFKKFKTLLGDVQHQDTGAVWIFLQFAYRE